MTHDDSLNVNGELNSSFLDKRLLFDLKIGWHHQLDEGLPGDGSEFNTGQEGTIAGTPGYVTSTADLQNIATLDDQVPAAVKAACAGPFANTECGFTGYVVGGPGFIERLTLDSYQARGALTWLANASGHHVIKGGCRRDHLLLRAHQGLYRWGRLAIPAGEQHPRWAAGDQRGPALRVTSPRPTWR